MPTELPVIYRFACSICGKPFQGDSENAAIRKASEHEKIKVKKIHVFEVGEEVEHDRELCKVVDLSFSALDHGPVYALRPLGMFGHDFTVRAVRVSKRVSGEMDSP